MFHFFEKTDKAIKNGQISLYCHFDKIVKGPGTSLQSPALSQKHIKRVCLTACLTCWFYTSI